MNLQKISKNILIIFMILEPLLDLYFLYSDNIINIFKFSPATIIRMIFILVMVIFIIILNKKKLNKKNLVIFIMIYLAYSLFHLYNGTLFKGVSTYHEYSLFKEAFYLVRMTCPLVLFYLTYKNDIDYQDTKKIIIIVYFIFSSIMVLTNLVGIARVSYGVIKRETIIGNFLMWFKPGIYNTYTYEYFASKGLFSYANPLSSLMVSFLPLLVYIVLKEKTNFFNIITLFLTILAMIMLGTRIAGIGMYLVFIFSLIIYVSYSLIKNKKVFTKNFIICLSFLLIFLVIYKYTPAANRVINDDYETNSTEKQDADLKLIKLKDEIKDLEQNEKKEKEIEFLDEYAKYYGFKEHYYFDAYPYQEDPEFWFDLLEVPYQDRNDNRKIKTLITKRVFELNNNKLDYLVGFSFERSMNADNYMENDIIAQFYSMGILGLILFIFPYFYLICYALYKIIKEKKFTYLNITYIIVISLIYFTSILSGNVFDQWIVTFFLGFISGVLLKNIEE